MVIICQHCNKEYASYASRSNHVKKYHNSIVTKNVTNVTSNVTKCNKNVTEIINKEVDKTKSCKHCNKQFNSRQTRWRHEKTCKGQTEDNKLEKKLEDQTKGEGRN